MNKIGKIDEKNMTGKNDDVTADETMKVMYRDQ